MFSPNDGCLEHLIAYLHLSLMVHAKVRQAFGELVRAKARRLSINSRNGSIPSSREGFALRSLY